MNELPGTPAGADATASGSVVQRAFVPPPPIVPAERDDAALRRLRDRAREDLAMLNFPAADWVPKREPIAAAVATATPASASQVDVLIVGAGMCGQTAAFALWREGVRDLRLVDAAARGDEGPWGRFARMLTLRSPKHLTGADLGVPSLTYRAWHEAAYGREHWASLHKILTLDWRDYLLWVRDTVGLPVENGVRLVHVRPRPDDVEVLLQTPTGPQIVVCRELVLAMGRDGSGGERWPEVAGLDPGDPRRLGRVFHADEPIDFAALEGRRVAVLGAGASAFDNAATALEAGAARVDQYVRRPFLPQVNKSKWTSFPGFLHGFSSLDDARRWAFYTYVFDEQVPPPWESVQRCDRHPNFDLRFGRTWTRVAIDDDGLRLTTRASAATSAADDLTERYDAAIVATGFDVDLTRRPELRDVVERVLRWGDRVDADARRAFPEPARFPYLGAGFELQARDGAGPGGDDRGSGAGRDVAGQRDGGLGRLRLFNWGATMSHGAIAGDIPGLGLAAGRLARAIVRALFVADADRHYQRMLAHNEEELAPTRRFVPLAARRA